MTSGYFQPWNNFEDMHFQQYRNISSGTYFWGALIEGFQWRRCTYVIALRCNVSVHAILEGKINCYRWFNGSTYIKVKRWASVKSTGSCTLQVHSDIHASMKCIWAPPLWKLKTFYIMWTVDQLSPNFIVNKQSKHTQLLILNSHIKISSVYEPYNFPLVLPHLPVLS